MPATTVSEAQSGSVLKLKRGDELIVSLAENPTTGFRWAVEANAAPCLSAASSEFQPSGASAAGAGGHRVFRFLAASPGKSQLRLVLRQEWQPNAPASRFDLSIHVAD